MLRIPPSPTTVERCGVGRDLLHRIFDEHLDAFLMEIGEAGRALPGYVEAELRRFASCGDPALGFAWLVCDDCDHHRLVPFSCGGRGFCPSCAGRRMASRAAHWVDRVFPQVPVRQWVLTFPWSVRLYLARNHRALKALHGIFVQQVQRWYRSRAAAHLKLPSGRTGAITVVQRAGSDLRLNPHLHSLFIDGVYVTDPASGKPRFHHLPPPTTDDVESLVQVVAARCTRWLIRAGFLDEEAANNKAADEEDEDEGALGPLQAASIARRIALGLRAGKQVRRYRVLGGKKVALPPRCASYDGFNLHAGVVIGAHNREGLERVCRYVARGPLAKSRLEERADGTLVLQLGRTWSDGTQAVLFEPTELIERLAALVPRPRANLVLYTGVLAPRAKGRRDIVPDPADAPLVDEETFPTLVRPARAARRGSQRRAWLPWSYLLWRTFGALGWHCPRCDKKMRRRAVVLHPPATTRILVGLAEAARAPPTSSALAG